MGSPKALLMYRGETFLDRLVGVFAARLNPVIVVLGAAEEEVRARTLRAATFVVNGDYAVGQTSSLQCGLRAVPTGAEGILMTLVDRPAVAEATVDALVSAGSSLPLRVPRYQGRRGHPIWFSRALVAEFLALGTEGAASDVVHRHTGETEFLDLDDPGITANVDDPAAYRALVESGL